MFVHYRSPGIILKKIDRGEADQQLSIYTKDFGKLAVLAKAVRKISSKLKSSAGLLYLSEIEFVQGKANKTLTDAILIDKFQGLRNDLKKLAVAFRISEATDNLIKGQEPDPKIWKLLNETFQKLNNLQFTIYSLQLLYYYFLWNLFSILGYKPELYRCVACRTKLKPEKLFFSQKEGGVICKQCRQKSARTAMEISQEAIKILRIILDKNWEILSRLKVENHHLKPLNEISRNYL